MKTLDQTIGALPPERREKVAKRTKQLIAEENAPSGNKRGLERADPSKCNDAKSIR